MARHNKTGEEGELRATLYLKEAGYHILHTNWRVGHYELDIVAEKDNQLVIVEVKTRTSLEFEIPEAAVGKGKIRRIVSAADEYMQINNMDLPVRFDIISIYKNNEKYEIEHIEDAFYPPIM
ncbi:MAG: YraN family protein [Candidatus Azobacteroides sp.]|nr:YraN family protein [Candidatus Azobacteroides sp.]